MKRILLGMVLLFVAAAIVLGPGRVVSFVRGMQTQVRDDFDNGQSDEAIAAQVKVKLKDLDGQVRAYHVKVGEVADKLAAVETRAEDFQKQLDARKQLLGRVKSLLELNQFCHEVSGKVYTRREITEDGKAHLAECQRLEQKLESQRKLAGDLKKALEQGKNNLAEAKRVKHNLLSELDALQVRLTNARLRKELTELTTALVDAPLGPDSELAREFGKLRTRAARLEREDDYLRSAPTGNGVVDWSANGSSEDVTQSISRYLRQPGSGNTSKK